MTFNASIVVHKHQLDVKNDDYVASQRCRHSLGSISAQLEPSRLRERQAVSGGNPCPYITSHNLADHDILRERET